MDSVTICIDSCTILYCARNVKEWREASALLEERDGLAWRLILYMLTCSRLQLTATPEAQATTNAIAGGQQQQRNKRLVTPRYLLKEFRELFQDI